MPRKSRPLFDPTARASTSKVFPIRMSVQTHAKMQKLSAELHVSMHDLIIQAIEFALEHRQ